MAELCDFFLAAGQNGAALVFPGLLGYLKLLSLFDAAFTTDADRLD